LANGDIVTCSTPVFKSKDSDLNAIGINLAHAYSILDTLVVSDNSRNMQERLIYIRNPWGEDYFKGSYSD
jgi:prophage tail gpP-like protein